MKENEVLFRRVSIALELLWVAAVFAANVQIAIVGVWLVALRLMDYEVFALHMAETHLWVSFSFLDCARRW